MGPVPHVHAAPLKLGDRLYRYRYRDHQAKQNALEPAYLGEQHNDGDEAERRSQYGDLTRDVDSDRQAECREVDRCKCDQEATAATRLLGHLRRLYLVPAVTVSAYARPH